MHALGWWSQFNHWRLLADHCQLTGNRWQLPPILSVNHQQHQAVGCQAPPALTSLLRPFLQSLMSDVRGFSIQ